MQDEPEAGAAETGREQGMRPFSARAERALIASMQMALIPVALLILAALGAFAYGIAVFITVSAPSATTPSRSATRSACSCWTSTCS